MGKIFDLLGAVTISISCLAVMLAMLLLKHIILRIINHKERNRQMTREQNVRAILETIFSESKDELVDIAVKKIIELSPQRSKGHWEYNGSLWCPWTCSDCGYENEEQTDYCPGCGLDMRESEEIKDG